MIDPTRFRAQVEQLPRYSSEPFVKPAEYVALSDVLALIAALEGERPSAPDDPSITCPDCGIRTIQKSSATLDLALSQHRLWVCSRKV